MILIFCCFLASSYTCYETLCTANYVLLFDKIPVPDTKKPGNKMFPGKKKIQQCFLFCKAVQLVVFPALFNISSIEQLEFPSGLTSIGSYAFSDNPVIKIVANGNSIDIGENTFYSNNNFRVAYIIGQQGTYNMNISGTWIKEQNEYVKQLNFKNPAFCRVFMFFQSPINFQGFIYII